MSDYSQTSFLGGMNVLSNDTRLQSNEYRYGFNIRNRYDTLDPILTGTKDTSLPVGIIQEHITFGNYVIAFVAGYAYYRLFDRFGWTQIVGFEMSPTAERYWTCEIPLTTTNYVRYAGAVNPDPTDTAVFVASAEAPLKQLNIVAGAAEGNLPGLLVQDNINQPQFIYIDIHGLVRVRVTQTYEQWEVDYDPVTGVMTTDKREYVPIGNVMDFVDGVLYIANKSKTAILRSVSGRPLDFVVNVDLEGQKGGDASTTAYSVGVGEISCLRGMQDGSLFVAAGNANFQLVNDTSPNAPLIFGEYKFIRKYLFEATCLNDRCIIDSLGDTRFIDLTGVRSFNAISQIENEGRNSQFTAGIQELFIQTIDDVDTQIVQDIAAAILYDNYELYAVTTIFGPVILVYDTLSKCWSSIDNSQAGGAKIKQFAKIELGVQRLYAITENNELYLLYMGEDFAEAGFVTGGLTTSEEQANGSVKVSNAKFEVKPLDFRCIIDNITEDCIVTLTPFINNRVSNAVPAFVKSITYTPPETEYIGLIPGTNKQLTNLYFPLPDCEQGWKVFYLLTWTGGGSIVQFNSSMKDLTPMNPPTTQATTA